MGFFRNLFQRKKNRETEAQNRPEDKLVLRDGIYSTPEERAGFVKNCCDMINEAKRQQFEAKKEYEVVTAYLADIQKIDLLPTQAKKSIDDMARKLLALNQERQKMQKITPKITMAQRLALEPYEDTILEEIRKMEEQENYLQVINSDIRHLESEKASLDFELQEVMERDELGKKMLKAAGIFIIVFLAFLFILQETAKKNVQLPFVFTIAFGIIVIAYFYFSNRKNQYDLKLAELKMNRAIQLLNKVKIKYVNCTNLLDYLYEKFHVNNAQELHYHWQEYMRIVEEERRFKKTAESIDFYTEEIIRELKKNGVSDAAVWGYQIEALVDPKEMVEVRHRLNVRRQKLRQRIDYNNNQEEMARKSLRAFRERHVAYDSETLLVLAKNEVEL
ncbi:MAG: hypothetical protein IKL28_03380 [Lachnospiraceae bacterium]|nr:hypothetical protein [Lachnospiraceae bacterium]MBR6642685.1 hypothetical protein [Lachnospiraceae bacterium]